MDELWIRGQIETFGKLFQIFVCDFVDKLTTLRLNCGIDSSGFFNGLN